MAAKNQIIIPVGEYFVSADVRSELVTVVGSCVAVALFDKKTQTGGLVHIVLPGDRSNRRRDDNQAFYADTGMSLLLEEMGKGGSKEQSLVAGVAGGASTLAAHGESTIGKRNAKAVITILENRGIPIDKKDIGGSSARKVSLYIDTGELQIQTISSRTPPPGHGERKQGVIKSDIAPLIKIIENLKPDEDVSGELLEMVHRHGSSINDLQKIISRDLILACHIFRMCNSSYYGFPGRISSINDAVRLLGNRQFRLICVVAGTMRQKQRAFHDITPAVKKLNRHSHGTAVIAEQLALMRFPDLKDEAYSAGLLHGIGKLGAALMLARTSQNGIYINDSALIDKEHGVMAERILSAWNIPGRIADAVLNVEIPFTTKLHHEKLTAILHVACGINRLLGVSVDSNICVNGISPEILRLMNLPERLDPLLPIFIAALKSTGIVGSLTITHGSGCKYEL